MRRSNFRLAQIEHRLEVLGGYLIAYLNLDKVIKIIRNEDEPKPVLMKTFKLTDVQADAILNMRLRNLRKLEEMEIRKEDKELRAERKELKKLLGSEKEQWKTVAGEIKKVRDKFGPKTPLGKRRTDLRRGAASTTRPRSRRRWSSASRSPSWCPRRAGSARCAATSPICRASRSRPTTASNSRSPPRPRRSSWCSPPTAASTRSTARSCRAGAGTASRCGCSSTSSRTHDLVAVFRHQGGRKFLVASAQGRGFVVAEDECLANTRKGKQVLNVKPPDEARAVAVVEGELVAAIGENRKMVIFPLEQVPEMARGRGVRLQRYKDGGLSDVKTFKAADGLTWIDSAGRTFILSLKELAAWRGNRGDAGRLAPERLPDATTSSASASRQRQGARRELGGLACAQRTPLV